MSTIIQFEHRLHGFFSPINEICRLNARFRCLKHDERRHGSRLIHASCERDRETISDAIVTVNRPGPIKIFLLDM